MSICSYLGRGSSICGEERCSGRLNRDAGGVPNNIDFSAAIAPGATPMVPFLYGSCSPKDDHML